LGGRQAIRFNPRASPLGIFTTILAAKLFLFFIRINKPKSYINYLYGGGFAIVEHIVKKVYF
jgi:hypothetical protein